MRGTAPFVVALALLTCGVGMAAPVQTVKPKTPASPVLVKPIDQQILDDHAKLSKSFPTETKTRLEAITRQLMLRVPNLSPKTTALDIVQREVQTAFPSMTSKSETDAMVFWVITEATKGAQQDLQELLAQKRQADDQQRKINEMLTLVRRKLNRDNSEQSTTSENTKTTPTRKLPVRYTRNMHVEVSYTAEVTYTTKDIDTASRTTLEEMEQKLESANDDAMQIISNLKS